MMEAELFLKEYLKKELLAFSRSPGDEKAAAVLASAWMNDGENSAHRFRDIEANLPGAGKILDMACGCGTFFFYGMLNGYDVYGVDPEVWKHEFNRKKAREKNYPPEWLERLSAGMGESLPYENGSFDCVSTYQTLEHVQDVRQCLREMVRVVRPGGGIHIKCPDYRGTFEGHYRLPWFPFFPRALMRMYLRLLRKPAGGMETIRYVSQPMIARVLKEISAETGKHLSITDLNRKRFNDALIRRGVRHLSFLYPAYRLAEYFRNFCRREMEVDLWVEIKG